MYIITIQLNIMSRRKDKISILSMPKTDIRKLFSSKKKANVIECGKKKLWSIKYGRYRRNSTKNEKTWKFIQRKSFSKSG